MEEQKKTYEYPTVDIRYFAYNCVEIKLPDGKTLVVDPCLVREGPKYAIGYDENDLDGCDYIFITHTHYDHVISLAKVYNKFYPQAILASERVSYDLAEQYDLPYLRFYPFTEGQEYDFNSFKIKIMPCHHKHIGDHRPSGTFEAGDYQGLNLGHVFKDEHDRRTYFMGHMYSYSFLLTLPNNFKIALLSGPTSCLDEYAWRDERPNLVLAQGVLPKVPDYAEQMANVIRFTGCQMLVPIHVESVYKGLIDPKDYTAKVNQLCEEQGMFGRLMFFERAKWYSLSMNVTCKG